MSTTIRVANLADAPFLAAFNIAMARETESKDLHSETVLAGVQNLIRRPALGFYLIAEHEGVPAGCLLITSEWSDWRNGLFWWVQSVYVLPEFRRRGIYRSLYQQVKILAARRGDICGIRLYVEHNNLQAQSTYQKLGMTDTGYLIYEEMLPTAAPKPGS